MQKPMFISIGDESTAKPCSCCSHTHAPCLKRHFILKTKFAKQLWQNFWAFLEYPALIIPEDFFNVFEGFKHFILSRQMLVTHSSCREGNTCLGWPSTGHSPSVSLGWILSLSPEADGRRCWKGRAELRTCGRKERRCCFWKWDRSAGGQTFFACVPLNIRQDVEKQIPPKV